MFDMNKCKNGDWLRMRDGNVAMFIGKDYRREGEAQKYQISYKKNWAIGTRSVTGSFGSEKKDSRKDVVGFAEFSRGEWR